MTKDQVSRLCRGLDEQVRVFRERPLEGTYPYLWLDAKVERVREPGRLARGVRNRFLDRHGAAAPAAYPEIHHLTAPLRQAGRTAGDPGLVNLWAGQAYELGRQLPAGQLVRTLAEEARAALQQARERLGPPAAAEEGGSGAERP
jgi:Transposase, Mutator family/Nitronate monooxygenase